LLKKNQRRLSTPSASNAKGVSSDAFQAAAKELTEIPLSTVLAVSAVFGINSAAGLALKKSKEYKNPKFYQTKRSFFVTKRSLIVMDIKDEL